jgi:hypothetical protein
MNGTPSTSYVSATVTTRTYQAIVNNEVKPVTVDGASDPFGGTVGLYQVTGYNADGYVTLATPASTSLIPKAYTNTVAETSATSNLVASSGTITLINGGTTYYYATSSKLFTLHRRLDDRDDRLRDNVHAERRSGQRAGRHICDFTR